MAILTIRSIKVPGTRTRSIINNCLVGEAVERICVKRDIILSYICVLGWVISKANSTAIWSWLMIGDLRPRLYTWWAKWAERPPTVMKRNRRWTTLQICSRRDSNSGGSDPWYNALPIRPRRRLALRWDCLPRRRTCIMIRPCTYWI